MKRHLGIAALIVTQILSGINNPIIRHALQTMPIYLWGFLRVGIAMLIIVPIALLARSRRPKRKQTIKRQDFWWVVAGSIAIYCVSNLAFYKGIHQSTSMNSAVILLLQPIIFFMITIEVLKERFSPKVFAGILLAFVGAVIVVIGPLAGHAKSGGSVMGNVLIFVSVLADVAGAVILKKVLKRVHVLDTLAIGLVVATIFYFILAIPQLHQLSQLSDPKILGAVLYGALGMGCIGYSLGYFGLAATKGSDYSVISYLAPVTTMVAAALFFNETFTPSLVVGGLVVFAGLYLVEARHMIHFHGRIHGMHR